MDREKLLDKIRKCLALSKSSEEHEAAAALRQAQKLMEAHGLSKEDVGQVEYVSVVVVTDYEWPDSRTARTRGIRVPVVLKAMSRLIAHAIGVEAVYEPAEGMFAIRYFGPRARTMMAEHAHAVVSRAVSRSWRRYLLEHPYMRGRPGARAGFYTGWCQSVVDKVQRLVPSDEELRGLIGAKSAFYGRELDSERIGVRRLHTETVEAGMDASKSFDIHRPMAQDRLRIEKL